MADVAGVYGDLLGGIYRRFRADSEPINLIANGSFEEDGAADNAAPSAWKLAGGRFCVLSSEGATDGQLAAVFGDGTTASQPPTAHTATISQTVATRPGVRYRLLCDYAVYGNGAEANAKIAWAFALPAASHCWSMRSNSEVPPPGSGSQTRFSRRWPTAAISFSDATTNGESGLADGVSGQRAAGRAFAGGDCGRGSRTSRCRRSED